MSKEKIDPKKITDPEAYLKQFELDSQGVQEIMYEAIEEHGAVVSGPLTTVLQCVIDKQREQDDEE